MDNVDKLKNEMAKYCTSKNLKPIQIGQESSIVINQYRIDGDSWKSIDNIRDIEMFLKNGHTIDIKSQWSVLEEIKSIEINNITELEIIDKNAFICVGKDKLGKQIMASPYDISDEYAHERERIDRLRVGHVIRALSMMCDSVGKPLVLTTSETEIKAVGQFSSFEIKYDEIKEGMRISMDNGMIIAKTGENAKDHVETSVISVQDIEEDGLAITLIEGEDAVYAIVGLYRERELEKENFGCYPGHGGDESSYMLRHDLDPNQHELYPNVEHGEDCTGPRLELEFPDMLYTDGLEMGER
jgi:hypothetical protein